MKHEHTSTHPEQPVLGGCCPVRAPQPAGSEVHTDPASESLANALRVSFRLLSVLMVLVLVAFLASGIQSVDDGQVAIKTVFGRVTGTAGPGLTFNWPFPVGQVTLVDTQRQTTSINEFWMHETAEMRAESELMGKARRVREQSLRPGWDGALFTGDRNLYHVIITTTWQIPPAQAIEFMQNVGGPDQAKEVIYNVISDAAVRSAANLTAEGIQSSEQVERFRFEIQEQAQRSLDSMDAGVRLVELTIQPRTWPLRVLPHFVAALDAQSEMNSRVAAARAEAERILNQAAGAAYRELVGDPGVSSQDQGLIGQYIAARTAGDMNEAARVRAQIDALMLSNRMGGRAAEEISQARSYRTASIHAIESRVRRFRELVNVEDRELLLARMWADAADEILGRGDIEKIFPYPSGDGRSIMYMSRDPQMVRDLERERLRAQQERVRGGRD